MNNSGIMQEIRELLSQGKSSTKVIALGYKPSTVYKVQRQLRRTPRGTTALCQAADRDESVDQQSVADAASIEDVGLMDWLLGPFEEPTLPDESNAELEQARKRIKELEEEEAKVVALQERVASLEAEAEKVVALSQCIGKLKHQLEHAAHTQDSLRRSNVEWQIKFLAEQKARRESERQAQDQQDRASHSQEEYRTLQFHLTGADQVIKELRTELARLEPLKAWAGHPCSACHKPMSGAVDRELAGQMMKELAHKGCLENRGSGLAKLLLAGGVLLGASQLGKR